MYKRTYRAPFCSLCEKEIKDGEEFASYQLMMEATTYIHVECWEASKKFLTERFNGLTAK